MEASATEPVAELARAAGPAGEERTALEAGISRVEGAETETPLEEVPEVRGVMTGQVRARAAAAAPRAWALTEAAAEPAVGVAEVVGAGKRRLL